MEQLETRATGGAAERAPSEPIRTRSGPTWLGAVLLSLVMSAVTAGAALYVYHTRFAWEIVSVDVEGYIQEVLDAARQGRIDESEARRAVERLHRVVAALPPRYVPISNDVILRRGVPELELPALEDAPKRER